MPEQWSPWLPISESRKLKVLCKLAEECGELTSVISRCIIQGIDELHPITNKSNRQWLEEEIADVLTSMGLIIVELGLDIEFMEERSKVKEKLLAMWLKVL